MILKRLRSAFNGENERHRDSVTLDHCRQCEGDCPFIEGCC